MKVVVTGGAGFIGANLCRELVTRPSVSKVVVLDNLSTGFAENLDGVDVELVVGSILDQALLQDVVDRADAVVHLAARPSVPRSVVDPVASHEANAAGTLHVLEACRRTGSQVIAASSSSVYGPTVELPKHEDLPTRPQSPYAASKLAAEAYVLAYAATYQVPTLAFRFFNVYGPLQPAGHAYAAAIPAFIDAALRGRPLQVHGDGRQTRDFTFVGNVVGVLADAVESRAVGTTPINLAFGTRISILDLIRKIGDIAGRPTDIEFTPARTGDVRDSQAADGRLRAMFPGRRPTSLDTGLARTIEWFQAQPEYATLTMPTAAAVGAR